MCSLNILYKIERDLLLTVHAANKYLLLISYADQRDLILTARIEGRDLVMIVHMEIEKGNLDYFMRDREILSRWFVCNIDTSLDQSKRMERSSLEYSRGKK